MTDAGAAATPQVKSSKAGPSGEAGEKKRFEVKKVCSMTGCRSCLSWLLLY